MYLLSYITDRQLSSLPFVLRFRKHFNATWLIWFFRFAAQYGTAFCPMFLPKLGSVLCHLEHKLINIAKKWWWLRLSSCDMIINKLSQNDSFCYCYLVPSCSFHSGIHSLLWVLIWIVFLRFSWYLSQIDSSRYCLICLRPFSSEWFLCQLVCLLNPSSLFPKPSNYI